MGVLEYEAKPKLKANRKKRGIPSAARDYGISVTFSAKFKDEKKSIMPSWHRSGRDNMRIACHRNGRQWQSH